MSNINNFKSGITTHLQKKGIYDEYKILLPSLLDFLENKNDLQRVLSIIKKSNNLNVLKPFLNDLIKNIPSADTKKLKKNVNSTKRVQKYRLNTKKTNFQVMINPQLKKRLEALKIEKNMSYENLLEFLVKSYR